MPEEVLFKNMFYYISRIAKVKSVDKLTIIKIESLIHLFILKFNKIIFISKVNSVIIENKNYYGIY